MKTYIYFHFVLKGGKSPMGAKPPNVNGKPRFKRPPDPNENSNQEPLEMIEQGPTAHQSENTQTAVGLLLL